MIQVIHSRSQEQGRIIHDCAGCTMGGGSAPAGPPDQLPNF